MTGSSKVEDLFKMAGLAFTSCEVSLGKLFFLKVKGPPCFDEEGVSA
jgi:hypothetical protein